MADSEPKIYLTPKDRDIVKRLVKKDAQSLEESHELDPQNSVPDTQNKPIYVAMPPCGEGIPARVGEEPGQNDCCIFRIVKNAEGTRLIPVENARATVFNIYTTKVPAARPPDEFYIQIHRDNFGRWLCEAPRGLKEGEELDDSSTTSSTDEPATTPAPCSGTCKWNWTSNGYWQLADNGCAPTTTTTETTTTPDPGTTTTTSTTTPDPNECECPTTTSTTPDPETTTSSTLAPTTTSTTTTTPAPCNCTYPTFCGEVGDCTYTQCAPGKVEHESVTCTSTTTAVPTTTEDPLLTTTCDCNTTSTAVPPPHCSQGCDWVWFPNVGWRLVDNRCSSNCPCAYPESSPGGDICVHEHTPCVPIVPGPAPPPSFACDGKCIYWCVPELGRYVLQSFECRGVNEPCFCVEPSEACDNCAPIETPCQTIITTTAAPPDEPPAPGSCDACYTTSTSTSTSTTTTPPPCSGGCIFHWNGEIWENVQDNCDDECPCYPPSHEGHDDCEKVRTPCISGTTTSTTEAPTTTTSTTTTTTCAPCATASDCHAMFQWRDGAWSLASNRCNTGTACDDGGYVADPAPVDPGDPCDCQEVPCHQTSTTECPPCPLDPNNATWQCQGSGGGDVWELIQDCDGVIGGDYDHDNGCFPAVVPCVPCGFDEHCDCYDLPCTTTTTTTTDNPCGGDPCQMICNGEHSWVAYTELYGNCPGILGIDCECHGDGGQEYLDECGDNVGLIIDGHCRSSGP